MCVCAAPVARNASNDCYIHPASTLAHLSHTPYNMHVYLCALADGWMEMYSIRMQHIYMKSTFIHSPPVWLLGYNSNLYQLYLFTMQIKITFSNASSLSFTHSPARPLWLQFFFFFAIFSLQPHQHHRCINTSIYSPYDFCNFFRIVFVFVLSNIMQKSRKHPNSCANSESRPCSFRKFLTFFAPLTISLSADPTASPHGSINWIFFWSNSEIPCILKSS